jgi:hypothetical protein
VKQGIRNLRRKGTVSINLISALGAILGGMGAVATVFVAVSPYGAKSQRTHERTSARALDAQARATREAREHERRLLFEERMWNRRVDLYARISLALRRYVEQPPANPDGDSMSAADVVELADLVSEADMLASKPLADLLNQFMYDNPDDDRQLDIWGTFQNAARDELELDRLQRPSKRVPAQLRVRGASSNSPTRPGDHRHARGE